jgi:transcriptional regulator
MYIPPAFRQDDLAALHKLMRDYSFATMITQHQGTPFATHLPLVLAPEEGPYGTLYGHMARANPQWHDFDTSPEVLVIFQGPHTYISPSWYDVELSVPTWNYAVVHAYAAPRLITDHDALCTTLDTLVRTYEAQFPRPWLFQQLPGDYVRKMLQGIVGFALPISRLEGKFKMSQNRPTTDQTRVATTLAASGDPMNSAVAELMRS